MEYKDNPEIYIYKDIRRKILGGQIKEGDRLVETALAVGYQASRLHIKSALRLLEQENLAQHIPKCGFIAIGVTEEAVKEIVELRIALERVVFKRLVEIASGEEIAQLRKMVQRATVFFQNDMTEDVMEEVDRFYSFVYEKSKLVRISSILETYTDYLQIIRRKSALDAERNQASLKLFREIMDAIEKRDVETLLQCIERRRMDEE